MVGRRAPAVALSLLAAATVSGCQTISGTPTWPGARLEKVVLKEADFPPGVNYGRIVEDPGQPDGGGGVSPSSLLSNPEGCSNGLTDVIAATAERGPGSAAKYQVSYDGARIIMTVLTSQLDLDQLAATAARCERFEAFFDADSERIPMTTTRLPPTRSDQLAYQQTMKLAGTENSVFMAFENIAGMAVFGIAFPTTGVAPGSPPPPKAELPQTFLEIVEKQAQRIDA